MLCKVPLSLFFVLDELEKSGCRFIWGDTNNSRKNYLVAWNKICKSKENKGLRIKNLAFFNAAFLSKVTQGYLEGQKLWAKMLSSKYNRVEDARDMFVRKPFDSPLRWVICKNVKVITQNCHFNIINGRDVARYLGYKD